MASIQANNFLFGRVFIIKMVRMKWTNIIWSRKTNNQVINNDNFLLVIY
jgi:hypothetical protein